MRERERESKRQDVLVCCEGFGLGMSFSVSTCMCVGGGKCNVAQWIDHSITITSEVTKNTHKPVTINTHTGCFIICVSSGQHPQPLDKHNSLLSSLIP